MRIEQSQLVDLTTGSSHALHGPAMELLKALAAGIKYRPLSELAHRKSASESQLRELLGFLNYIGGLERQRSSLGSLLALWQAVRHLAIGVRFSSLSHRYTCSLKHIFLASLHATTPVILATGVVASLNVAAGLLGALNIFVVVLPGLVLFIVSIAIHEKAHSKTLSKSKLPAAILQHGLRLGIVHPKLLPRQEIASALAGPIAGISVCLLAAASSLVLHQPSIGWVGLVIALLHLLSLAPLYGDGASLVKALKERKLIDDETHVKSK